MRVEELESFRGQPGFRVETPSATWVLHRQGAGLAAAFDPDGADWIGYRPGGGSDGKHRGIPNAAYPEGLFHPGVEACRTEVVYADGERVEIAASSLDGAWAGRWVFDAQRACFTLERAGHPYWFLYEGTPGGDYDEDQAYLVDSSGRRELCASRWEARIPEPRWVYFGAPRSRYVLSLIDATPRPAEVRDSYWSMQRNMTVFGFGRVLEREDPRWFHLTTTPARLVVALRPATDPEALAAALERDAIAERELLGSTPLGT